MDLGSGGALAEVTTVDLLGIEEEDPLPAMIADIYTGRCPRSNQLAGGNEEIMGPYL